MKSYVLVHTEFGAEQEVAKKLKMIEGVKSAEPVYGVYDIVVVIEAPNNEGICGIVSTIRHTDKARSTLTMNVVP